MAEATPAQPAQFRGTGQLPGHWGDQALASGVSTAYLAAAAFAPAAALTALFVIQVRPSDLERLRGGGRPGP